MAETTPTLLMTRPKERSEVFIEAVETAVGRPLQSIISPVFEIIEASPVPDLKNYQTLILTSASALAQLAQETEISGKNVATVGEMTARMASDLGAHAVSLGQDVEEFLASANQLVGPCIHLRGTHTHGQLAKQLSSRGIKTEEVAIYEQKALPLNDEAIELLQGSGSVVAPLFSPRSAKLLRAQGPFTAHVSAVAISQATASAWSSPLPTKIAQNPTFSDMCNATIETIFPANLLPK